MKFLLITFLMSFTFLSFANVQRANSEEGIIRFEYKLINRDLKPVDITFYFTLPANNERQEILYIYPEPGYKRIKTDSYGNRIVIYEEKNMKPGEVRNHGWIAHVKTYAVVYNKGTKIHKLSEKERRLYLKDKENYRINDPIVIEIKNKIVNDGDSDYNKALSLYKYLITNINYYRDDKWEPAPDILKNKKGSCSEFNYTLVSLLRAANIPARYTGSFTLRDSKTTKYDKYTQEDAVFHRWTEVFLSHYGWIPFDASRGSGSFKRSTNYLDYVGRLPAGALQSYRGDGGKDNLLKWDYISTYRTRKGVLIRDIPVSYFISFRRVKGSLQKSISKVRSLIKSGLSKDKLFELLKNPIDRSVLFLFKNAIKSKAYPDLIRELIKIGHPEAVYYSLYSNHIKAELPYLLNFAVLTDDFLKKSIGKYLNESKWDWQLFEYWWRKARPYVKYDKKLKLFVLKKKNINIY